MVASYIRTQFDKEEFARYLISMLPCCDRNVHGCKKNKNKNKYLNTVSRMEKNVNYRERTTISVSQQVVPGPPTPLFVRLRRFSSSLHSWVWSRGQWVEGEASFAASSPLSFFSLHPACLRPLSHFVEALIFSYSGHCEGFPIDFTSYNLSLL